MHMCMLIYMFMYVVCMLMYIILIFLPNMNLYLLISGNIYLKNKLSYMAPQTKALQRKRPRLDIFVIFDIPVNCGFFWSRIVFASHWNSTFSMMLHKHILLSQQYTDMKNQLSYMAPQTKVLQQKCPRLDDFVIFGIPGTWRFFGGRIVFASHWISTFNIMQHKHILLSQRYRTSVCVRHIYIYIYIYILCCNCNCN